MTTTIPDSITDDVARDDHGLRAGPSTARGWAVAGALAGLAGTIGILASSRVDAVYDPGAAGDAEKIVRLMADQVPQMLIMHVSLMLGAVLLLVFAAGLRRRLRAQAPADSLLPDVAASGLALTSVAGLMGTAFTTEIVFGLMDLDRLAPEYGVVVGHWVATVPWLWVGAGVTGVALAVAALRHAAAPRWLGWVSAVLGGLTLLLGLSPLQYMAGFIGPVLVLVLGLGFAFGDRRTRRSR